jgi:hypothetical protein
MPPRYTYWTIILDGLPTAFRAAARDDLLPVLRQLRSTNPGAVLKWFARGQVWNSPEDARPARFQTRQPPAERRPRYWRPGGEHRDPRERFKKETYQARKRRERKAAALAEGAKGTGSGPVLPVSGKRPGPRWVLGGGNVRGKQPGRVRSLGAPAPAAGIHDRRRWPSPDSAPTRPPGRAGESSPRTPSPRQGANPTATASPAVSAVQHGSTPTDRAPAVPPAPDTPAPAHETASPRLRKPR